MSDPKKDQVAFDARYVESLLLDESNIASRDYATGLDLLRNYSNIPEEQITSHVAEIVNASPPFVPEARLPHSLVADSLSNAVPTPSVHTRASAFSVSSSAPSQSTHCTPPSWPASTITPPSLTLAAASDRISVSSHTTAPPPTIAKPSILRLGSSRYPKPCSETKVDCRPLS